MSDYLIRQIESDPKITVLEGAEVDRAALVEPALIEIRTDRARNVELHREVHERIAHATSANR